jgi:hypothetical protein
MKIEISNMEEEIFRHYNVPEACWSDPVATWRIAQERAFDLNAGDDMEERVRRGFRAISKCSPYRLTEEFENLIGPNYEY